MELEEIIDGNTEEPAIVEDTVVVEEPKTEEPAPEAKAEESPEAKEAPVKEQVPLATYLEERNDRKRLEARVSEMETAMQEQPKVKAPDMFSDPEGYNKHMGDEMAKVAATTRMDMSQAIAEEKHGSEAVAGAFEALKASGDATAINSILAQKLPYQALMAWDKKRVALQEIGDDPKAWRESERAKIKQELQAEMTANKASAAAGLSAPSMANVTGTGGGPKSVWNGPTSLESAIGD